MRILPRPRDDLFDQILREQKESEQREKRREQRRQDERQQDEKCYVPESWLYEMISLQQAEADNTNREGGVNDVWERLKALLQTGNEISAPRIAGSTVQVARVSPLSVTVA